MKKFLKEVLANVFDFSPVAITATAAQLVLVSLAMSGVAALHGVLPWLPSALFEAVSMVAPGALLVIVACLLISAMALAGLTVVAAVIAAAGGFFAILWALATWAVVFGLAIVGLFVLNLLVPAPFGAILGIIWFLTLYAIGYGWWIRLTSPKKKGPDSSQEPPDIPPYSGSGVRLNGSWFRTDI